MRELDKLSVLNNPAGLEIPNAKKYCRKVSINSFPFLALALSACGGGGTSNSNSVSSTNTSTSNNTITENTDSDVVITEEVPIDIVGGGGVVGGGIAVGGGGGGGSVSLPASGSNTLSLYRVGSDYASSSFSGLALLNGDAHFQVANAASNNYSVKLTAQGAGLLKFEFADANDVITLLDGSVVSGFSQMKVINGTVDATNADLGLIDYISVASSVKLTASQVSNLDTIVINSASGGVEIVVASQSDIDLVSNAISGGNLNIFSPGSLVSYSAESGSGVSQTQLATAETTANVAVQALTAVNVSEISQSQTVLAQRSFATLSIENDDIYINNADAQSQVKFLVDASDGYTVTSVRVGSVTLNGSNGEYLLDIGSSNLSDGTHQVIVELSDPTLSVIDPSLGYTQSTITLSADIEIDTSAPSNPVVIIEGSSNSINAFEAQQPLDVSVVSAGDAEVSSISMNGTALTQSGDNYLLDAKNLADGNYTVDIVMRDQAGNLSSYSQAFTVDADALQEATITVAGGDLQLSATEATGVISLSVALNGATNLVRVDMDGTVLSADTDGSYDINVANLSEGTYTITAVSSNDLGEQITSQTDLVVDRTAPTSPDISVVNGSGGLTSSERIEPVNVVIIPEAGGITLDVRLDGSSISEIAEGVYQFAANGLASGLHTLSVTTQDAAGNQASVTEDVMVVGSTTVGSQIFEFQTSTQGDVITFDAFVKNSHANLPDGIPSFDFWIDLVNTDLNYVEGSFEAAPGATFLTSENGAKGEIFATGFFLTPWDQYDEAFFSFDARQIGSSSTHTISFDDFLFYTTDVGDFSVSVDV